MKKILWSLLIVLLFVVSGCGDNDEVNKIENNEEIVSNPTTSQNTEDSSESDTDSITNDEEQKQDIEQSDQADENNNGSNTESDSDNSIENQSEPVTNESETKNNGNKPSNDTPSSPPLNNDEEGKIINGFATGEMEPSIDYKVNNRDLTLNFKIKNQKDFPFTFHFDSHQQFDYILSDEKGNVVQQYSKIMNFSKLPTEAFVKPGGSLNYEVTIKDLSPGTYKVVFFLTAKEMQPKTGIEVVIK